MLLPPGKNCQNLVTPAAAALKLCSKMLIYDL